MLEQKLFNRYQEAIRDGTKAEVERSVTVDGFPVNFVSPTGRTPLHLAAERGDHNTVSYLLDHGADCTKLDKKGATCAHYAAKAGSCKTLDLLKDILPPSGLPADAPPGSDTAFHWAVWGIKFDVAKMLYDMQPDLSNQPDSEGDTALHWACLNSRPAIAKRLIQDFNANPEAVSSTKSTPLHIASTQGDLDICKLLVEECNVDVNAKDMNGDTPLHLAVSFEHLPVVTFLLKSESINPVLVNDSNQTPLDVAVDLRIEGGFQAILEAAAEGRLDQELEGQEKLNQLSMKLEEAVAAAKRIGAY
eukprot:TRINITY_DN19098_c0_g1_i1.p1 TRINITY_DN19098_c0_g1~~TRINITY_DN19098_c0_g1_i1.p1  ORF type:complete len:317 (+),score=64.46 TRINITY_DN19098_c0_g1_i1:42-953(+)